MCMLTPRRPSTPITPTRKLPGQQEIADAMKAAAVARAESRTAEKGWSPQLEAMCAKIKSPAAVAALRQGGKLLAVRSFRHVEILRGELHRLENIAKMFEQVLASDLRALSTQLRQQHEAATSCLAAELRAAEAREKQLQEGIASRDAEISRLHSTVADTELSRRLEADRVSALMPDGDAQADDDERFEAHLVASVHAYRQVRK